MTAAGHVADVWVYAVFGFVSLEAAVAAVVGCAAAAAYEMVFVRGAMFCVCVWLGVLFLFGFCSCHNVT